ncbi:MAG TPA: hypothetical protein PKI59_07360, partial [Candidatus Cloacimonadota bacterium]|nr:hypothetical protein [Candidatus Cloacimonadota bacterium]
MKTQTTLISIVLLVVLLAMPIWLVATEPAIGLRLSSFIQSNSNEASPDQSNNKIYHYRQGCFAIIDSMVQIHNAGYGYITYTTFNCQTTLTYPEAGHHRYDYYYYHPNGELADS